MNQDLCEPCVHCKFTFFFFPCFGKGVGGGGHSFSVMNVCSSIHVFKILQQGIVDSETDTVKGIVFTCC